MAERSHVRRAAALATGNPPTLVADKAYQPPPSPPPPSQHGGPVGSSGASSSGGGAALVPVNAPFGGSQGYVKVTEAPHTTVSPDYSKKPDVVTGKLIPPMAPPRPEQPEVSEGISPGPGGGKSITEGPSRTGLILGLGIGLIVVNAVFGNNAGSLLSGIWYKPDQQSPTTPLNNFFPIIGEVIFLVILMTIARFGRDAENLVLTFLIGLWLLWAMFRLPAVYKAGIPGAFGKLLSQGPESPASSTGQASSQPAFGQPYSLTLPPQPNQSASAFGQPYAFSVPRQGGSFVGTVPHQVSILG